MATILSIQSHVAYGHVGNRAAVFPLQRLGHEVWAIHTVQFSNHTGYGAWTGQVFDGAHIRDVVDGIDARGVLAGCDAVLSGYMGDAGTGAAILDAVARVRAAHPGAVYCLDPVMGDVGRGFFVRPGLPEFIRDAVMPSADILTPNQFELGFLAGGAVQTLEDALAACAAIRARGPRAVLVTSLTRPDAHPDRIEMLLDTTDAAHIVATPRLPLEPAPNGAGDCVAALLLAALLDGCPPETALARSAAGIFAVFEETARKGTRELQIIAAQDRLDGVHGGFAATRVR